MSTDDQSSSVVEAQLPGLSKIEFIEYQWLASRGEGVDPLQRARFLQLQDKVQLACDVIAATLEPEQVTKIGDLVVRYAHEPDPQLEQDPEQKPWQTLTSAIFGRFARR